MQIKSAPKIIPKILSLFLVLATIFTMLPTIAFADDGYNGDGGGNAGGSTGDGGTWQEPFQGYRMTIVTEQGWVVGSPVDFLFSEFPEGAEAYYDSKVEDLRNRKTANKRYRLDWIKGSGELKDAPPVPRAILWGKYGPGGKEGALGNGQALKTWMMGKNTTIQGDFNDDNGWIKTLLNYNVNNKFVFEFTEKYDKLNNVPAKGADGRYINSRTEIMAENKFVMLIEPILWFQPKTVGEKGYGNTVYGTITNHADWSKKAKDSGVFDDGNLYWVESITRKAGAWSLFIDKNEEFINRPGTWTINAPTASMGTRVSVAELGNSALGLALHVYRIDNLKPDIPQTHTWDIPIPTPQPAPDPTKILKLPDEQVDKTRVFNIVKTYRDRITDEDDKEVVTHVATFSRTNNPALITIEDEPTYKVKEWFISETYNNPAKETTWEDNHNQAPTTGPTGTKPSLTEIKPKNTTLYVLLEKKIGDDKTNTAGPLVIEESQVTKAVETIKSDVTGWGPKTMTFSAADIT